MKEGESWKTNENGKHYVINSNGDVVIGMGGKISSVKREMTQSEMWDFQTMVNDTKPYEENIAKELKRFPVGEKIDVYEKHNSSYKKVHSFVKTNDGWKAEGMRKPKSREWSGVKLPPDENLTKLYNGNGTDEKVAAMIKRVVCPDFFAKGNTTEIMGKIIIDSLYG